MLVEIYSTKFRLGTVYFPSRGYFSFAVDNEIICAIVSFLKSIEDSILIKTIILGDFHFDVN